MVTRLSWTPAQFLNWIAGESITNSTLLWGHCWEYGSCECRCMTIEAYWLSRALKDHWLRRTNLGRRIPADQLSRYLLWMYILNCTSPKMNPEYLIGILLALRLYTNWRLRMLNWKWLWLGFLQKYEPVIQRCLRHRLLTHWPEQMSNNLLWQMASIQLIWTISIKAGYQID